MQIECEYCFKLFNRKPSAIKAVNYCSKECRHKDKYAVCTCDNCGKKFERHKSQITENTFCSRKCAKPFLSAKMSNMNEELNPTRMTDEVREKVRLGHLGKGSGKCYPKRYGVHEHRIVAAKMLGRPLKAGEVVHHIDEDVRNNHPLNLMVFTSQAEHARYHKNEIHNPELNYNA